MRKRIVAVAVTVGFGVVIFCVIVVYRKSGVSEPASVTRVHDSDSERRPHRAVTTRDTAPVGEVDAAVPWQVAVGREPTNVSGVADMKGNGTMADHIAERLSKPERPPWSDEEGQMVSSSPRDEEIKKLAESVATSAGPESMAHAINLLGSTQAVVGVVGAALLVDQPAWDDAMLRLVAEHADLTVPFFAVQALRDAGRDDEAAMLWTMLLDRMRASGDWNATVTDIGWSGTALRALVDLSAEIGDDERRGELLSSIEAPFHSCPCIPMSFSLSRGRIKHETDCCNAGTFVSKAIPRWPCVPLVRFRFSCPRLFPVLLCSPLRIGRNRYADRRQTEGCDH